MTTQRSSASRPNNLPVTSQFEQYPGPLFNATSPQAPNTLCHQRRRSCTVRTLPRPPAWLPVSGRSAGSSWGASMAGILEVRAAMMRRFSRLASSRARTRSRSSAISRSVRSPGRSSVVRDWSPVLLAPAFPAALIHPNAWNRNSRKFVEHDFSEVGKDSSGIHRLVLAWQSQLI
jgi:hypothetical protein